MEPFRLPNLNYTRFGAPFVRNCCQKSGIEKRLQKKVTPRLEGVRSTGVCVWSLPPQGRRGGGGGRGSQTPGDPKGSADSKGSAADWPLGLPRDTQNPRKTHLPLHVSAGAPKRLPICRPRGATVPKYAPPAPKRRAKAPKREAKWRPGRLQNRIFTENGRP